MTQIITFVTAAGNRIDARLVDASNKKTVLVKPFKWLKMPVIKIHRVKNQVQFTDRYI